MIHLQLAGRFGNHLFQWATAMCIQSDNRSVTLTYDDFHQNAPSPLLYQLVAGNMEIRKSNLTGRLLQIEDKYLSQSPLLKPFIYTEYNPYGISQEISKRTRMMRGFFQNWRNFSKVENQVFHRLNSLLINWIESNSEVEEFKAEIGPFHAVHVRKGDYSGTDFGILSAEYYQKNFITSSLPVVVFTDHENLGDEYIKAIEPSFVLTPKMMSTENTFALMSQANSIIAANSTYSWWAGFLISKKGGDVVIPNPWLEKHDPSDALIHPAMKSADSIFNSD